MKKLNRLVAFMLAIAMLFALNVTAFALPQDSYDVSIENGVIVERLTMIDSDGIPALLTRVTYPSGETQVSIEKQGKVVDEEIGRIDYQQLYRMVTSVAPMARVDVHDTSVFYHEYIGSSETEIIITQHILTVAAMSSLLAAELGLSLAAVGTIASWAVTFGNAEGVYLMEVSQSTYQVNYVYDDTYYIHCYHQTATGYDSQGNKLGSNKTTYQVIGG